MIHDNLSAEHKPFAKAKYFKNSIFSLGQKQTLLADFDCFAAYVDPKIAHADNRVSMALGAAHDDMDLCKTLVTVERPGHAVVGSEIERPGAPFGVGACRKSQDRRAAAVAPKRLQHLVTAGLG
jgi:hypothetical protein